MQRLISNGGKVFRLFSVVMCVIFGVTCIWLSHQCLEYQEIIADRETALDEAAIILNEQARLIKELQRPWAETRDMTKRQALDWLQRCYEGHMDYAENQEKYIKIFGRQYATSEWHRNCAEKYMGVADLVKGFD